MLYTYIARLLGKMVSFWEAFSGKRDVFCALTVLYSIYNIYSMVGRYIASITASGSIFTSGLL